MTGAQVRIPTKTSIISQSKLAIGRAALTGALSTTSFFVLCWLAGALNLFPSTHMLISLFTPGDPTSLATLGFGVVSAVLSGALGGTLIALFWNLTKGNSSQLLEL